MTLTELNNIEKILSENMETKRGFLDEFRNEMREKYESDWIEKHLTVEEKTRYESLKLESYQADNAFRSFMRHNWS